MESKMKRFVESLSGAKITPQRRLVLEVLLENQEEHLSAEEVYDMARKKDRGIGIATIYRTLEFLEETGALHRCDFGDGRRRYELSLEKREQHHHHHLVCLSCRKILEVEEDLLNKLETLITEKKGFKIIDHNVQFFGYCRDCRERKDS